MDSLAIALQLLLAAVFATAGLAKLLDLAGSRRALADFGVPERAVPIAGVLLPLAELATATALLLHPFARWGAVGALVLLVAFVAGIGRALSRGQAPDCHCFGQIHSAPAGVGTLVRNGVLAALSAIVVAHPGPPIDAWFAARSALELGAFAAGVAAVGLGALCLVLWLDNRGLRRDLADAQAEVDALPAGLPIGLPAPGFVLPSIDGETFTLERLRNAGLPVALVFMSPDCGGCQSLLPDLGRWQATLADRLTLAVLSIGAAEDNRPTFEPHGIANVMLQQGVEVMSDYRIRATPAAVMVGPDGTVASGPAIGAMTIEPLLRLTLRRQADGAGATAGVADG